MEPCVLAYKTCKQADKQPSGEQFYTTHQALNLLDLLTQFPENSILKHLRMSFIHKKPLFSKPSRYKNHQTLLPSFSPLVSTGSHLGLIYWQRND